MTVSTFVLNEIGTARVGLSNKALDPHPPLSFFLLFLGNESEKIQEIIIVN